MAVTRSNSADRGRASRSASRHQRRLSERRGRWAEWLAASLLICKGYRVLDRRVVTPFGEVDLIALRGRRVAFVEVKYRANLSGSERPITRKQAHRISKAAEHWLWRQKAYRSHHIGLDCVLVSRAWLPRHYPDALQHTA